MKHLISILFWKFAYLVGGNLNLRIHRLLWVPAVIGGNMMNWWRLRDYENTNPGITVHGAFPWEERTGQRRLEGFHTKDTDPLFVVWKVGFWLYELGRRSCHRFSDLVRCDCEECSYED